MLQYHMNHRLYYGRCLRPDTGTVYINHPASRADDGDDAYDDEKRFAQNTCPEYNLVLSGYCTSVRVINQTQ